MMILLILAVFLGVSVAATVFLCYHAPFTNWQYLEFLPNKGTKVLVR